MVNRPLNILYLAHRIPYPPNKGEKIRSFHQVRRLATRHRVFLGCVIDDRDDLAYVPALEKWCVKVETVTRSRLGAAWKTVEALATGQPLSTAPFRSPDLARRIQALLATESIDCVVVYSSAMAWYVRDLADVPVIVDFVDVDAEKWRAYAESRPAPLSWVYRREATSLAAHDREAARRCEHAVVVSQTEADVFRRCIENRPVSVISNGVDLDYFHPPAGRPAVDPAPVLVFTGVMDYWPNVDAVSWFASDVFPAVQAVSPDARFVIVGRRPSPAVSALAARPGVVVTGAVDDVRPFLDGAAVAVAPFRIARGIQNKVLEAMAMGLPVVGTGLAFQGMAVGTEDGIRTADGAKGLAREIVFLLKNEDHRLVSGRRARAFVERHHRWDHQLTALETLLLTSVARRAGAVSPAGRVDREAGVRAVNDGSR